MKKRRRNARLLAAIISAMLVLSNISLFVFAEEIVVEEEQIEEEPEDDVYVEEISEGEDEDAPAAEEIPVSEVRTGSSGAGTSVTEETASEGDEIVIENEEGEEDGEDEAVGEEVSGNGTGTAAAQEEIVEVTEGDTTVPEEEEDEDEKTSVSGNSDEGEDGEVRETVSPDEIASEIPDAETEDSDEASLETAVESVTQLTSVNIDDAYNISASFKITAGTSQIRLDDLRVALYSYESVPMYDPSTREIQSGTEKYSFDTAKSDIVEPGSTGTFSVTIPATSVDSKGSGLTITDAITERRMHVAVGTATAVLDSLGNVVTNESQNFYVGTLYDPGTDGVAQKNYTLRAAKYDGGLHSLVYSRKLKADEKVLYSSDGKNWSDQPLSFKEIGTYTSYYMIVNSSTGSEVKWGTLTMQIKKGSVKAKKKHRDVSYYYKKAAKNTAKTKVIVSNNKTKKNASGTKTVVVKKKIVKRKSRAPKTGDALPVIWFWFSILITGLGFIGISTVEVPAYAAAGYGSFGFGGIDSYWSRRNEYDLYRAFVRLCASAIIHGKQISEHIVTGVSKARKAAYKKFVWLCAYVIVSVKRISG
ncbi:MAG: hypothetical protein K5668_04270 [Lachnospiraceae bacterium]|nr:hypothetical protein [Lachnospiraceae bacterium]